MISALRSLIARLRPSLYLRGIVRDELKSSARDLEERVVRRVAKGLDAKVAGLLEHQRENRLLIKRVERLLDGGSGRAPAGRPLPLTLSGPAEGDSTGPGAAPASKSAAAAAQGAGPAFAPGEMLALDACPVCGSFERTLVCEYNRFILLDTAPDDTARRYDYSLCHACGLVYAARRPVGSRFQHLLRQFSESLGRVPGPGQQRGDVLLNPHPLTADETGLIRQMAARGALVSEHLGVPRREYLAGALRDRLASGAHLELLGSLLPLAGARALEIRSRAGSLLASLRRVYGAEVYALPMFEGQQQIIRALYDIEASHLIDYDRFAIPYDVGFDLIVANHMFTHVLRPDRFFEALWSRLKPGGHVYLYNEPDEAEFLEGAQSMFNVLNAFHVQAFDGRSLVRALAANGFETVFLTHHEQNFVCLARRVEGRPAREPMGDQERRKRLEAYRRARDWAILALPVEARAIFSDEWEEVVERAVLSGVAEVDEKGGVRLVRTRGR